MTTTYNLNNSKNCVIEQTPLTPASMREAFSNWLSDGDDKKFSPQVSVACLDDISEYVKSKKISCSLWEISNPSMFESVYQKVISAKILRIAKRNTYKVFTVVGQLYLKFLDEKAWMNTTVGLAMIFEINGTEQDEITDLSIMLPGNKESATVSKIIEDNYNANTDVAQIIKDYDFEYVDSNLKGNRGRKYDLLRQWLIKNGNESIRVPFLEIANLVGGLPPSAYKHRAFWSNTDSHPFSVAWLNAGYKVVDCDLQTQYVLFTKVGIGNAYVHTCKKTVKSALIEFSNNNKGQIKTRREIIDELSSKYGHNEHSILPADYEIELNNGLPKLFRRIDYGTYECLGYNSEHAVLGTLNNTYSFVSDVDKEKMIKVIVTQFKNGFRNSSNIDFERFKNYYVDEYGEEFEYDADWLNSLISAEAFIYDDRAYIYGKDVVDHVRLYLEQIDSPCIFIDAFFNKYSSEFYTFSIFSIEMLRAFIEKNYKDVSVKWDYILMQENVSTYDLIKGVFSERETWSFDELQERLPYLKMATIRQTMNSAEYFRVDKGTYTHIDNIDLPDSEGKKIRMFVENKLLERDYVTSNDLDLSKFVDLNPHCSFYTVRDAVFYKFLSDSYDKNGQVITRVGVKLRVLDIMEQYCRKADFVSFEELNELEATFDPDGRTHSQCLIAGNNIMIRVSGELFVADPNVDFDVARIDDALELYCHDNFIPLRGVTDFSLFPFAGYPWNLFLLESYVRRFSRAFKFDVRAVNSANIGVIVRKSFDYNDYDDILALALAKSLVCLSDKKAVGDYLFENGYIGWRNLGKSEDKIIKNAEVLREGGTV